MKKNLTLLSFLAAAFIVNAQNVGIGTTTPFARLHVVDSSVLFSAAGDVAPSGTPGLPPMQNAGRRMMWYPEKAAFRTGMVTGANWNRDNIGLYSFASGFDSKASGYNSTALGASTASGTFSTALGYSVAKAYGSLSIGINNDITDNPDPLNLEPTDRIFQIGNGDDAIRSNAMTILRNGNVGIGILNPEFPLDINGRMRLSGTNPVPGIWLNAAGIDGAFVGLQNNDHIGFYGGNGGVGWGLTMNTQTGAVEINGNPGIAGQILQSNGSGSSPVWIDAANLKTKYYQRNVSLMNLPSGGSVSLGIPVTVYVNSIITASVTVNLDIGNLSGCTDGNLSITLERVGGGITPMGNFNYPCGKPNYTISTGEISVLNSFGDMNISNPGPEVIIISFSNISGPQLSIGYTSPAKILIKVTPI